MNPGWLGANWRGGTRYHKHGDEMSWGRRRSVGYGSVRCRVTGRARNGTRLPTPGDHARVSQIEVDSPTPLSFPPVFFYNRILLFFLLNLPLSFSFLVEQIKKNLEKKKSSMRPGLWFFVFGNNSSSSSSHPQ